MLVSKWRVFICTYERVSVIHRFPQVGKCQQLLSSNFSPSIYQRFTNQLNPLPPWAGSLTAYKTFNFPFLRKPSQCSYGIIKTEISLSFTHLTNAYWAERCTIDIPCPCSATQPVGGRGSTGTTDVLAIQISETKQPWFLALANVRGVNFPTVANFKLPTIFNNQLANPEYLKICSQEPPD